MTTNEDLRKRLEYAEFLLACVGDLIDRDLVLQHRIPYYLREGIIYSQREYKVARGIPYQERLRLEEE